MPAELRLARLAPSSHLADLADKYGSDKASRLPGDLTPYPWPAHRYDTVYEWLFPAPRTGVRRVFECGIGSTNPDIPSRMGSDGIPGASLRMWRDFFPDAQVVGADIDRDVLFAEDRISTHHVDQTDPSSVRALWRDVPAGSFDLMVDDGLHEPGAAQVLFEGSIHRLAPTGWYVIEDVAVDEFGSYAAWLASWAGATWFAVPEGAGWGLLLVRRS